MASLGVLAVLMLYVYGMVGWVIFDDHNPEAYGTLGSAMLTLFVLLSEGLPDMVADGLALSAWTTIYYISFVLIAAFLLLNILIGVVINSMEEARGIEAAREMSERRAAAAASPETADDLEVAVIDRLAALQRRGGAGDRGQGGNAARGARAPATGGGQGPDGVS